MLKGNNIILDQNTIFRSLAKGDLTFKEVLEEIVNYIKVDPNNLYKISIGTDSQVKISSVFVTCIHVHRVGKGAIGFLHKSEISRPIKNLREKIHMETCISLQLAYLFDEESMKRIFDALGIYRKKNGISYEFHIDVGPRGETKALINEMTGMVRGLNFTPKIKPESYCASCFADRYTKAI